MRPNNQGEIRYLAGSRAVYAAENMQQGRFAGTGRTDDRGHLTFGNREADMIECIDLCFALAVLFAEIFDC